VIEEFYTMDRDSVIRDGRSLGEEVLLVVARRGKEQTLLEFERPPDRGGEEEYFTGDAIGGRMTGDGRALDRLSPRLARWQTLYPWDSA
jgi:hypothetical protein